MSFFDIFRRKQDKSLSEEELNQKIEDIMNQQSPKLNSSYYGFEKFSSDISQTILKNNSEINNAIANSSATNALNDFYTATGSIMDALPIITDKTQRLTQWRNMSAFHELDFCLNEIANDFFHYDDNNNFINLFVESNLLNSDQNDILQSEFRSFISLFNFEDNGFKYIKRFLIDGELAWENIIDPKYPNLGIRGVKFILPEYYDSLIDKTTGEKVGIFVDTNKIKYDINSIISPTYYSSYNAFNKLNGTTLTTYSNDTSIPLLWTQVTYICSEDTTPDKIIPLSIVERCKQTCYQLALMQDSAIVMRLTRSPEKLLFNIDISNMSPKIAQEYVRRFGRDLQSKKVIGNVNGHIHDGSKGGTPAITSVYHPSSMTTMWVFGKGNNSSGTTVETVNSQTNFEQLEDIKYFLRRLFKNCAVPWSRYEEPTTVYEHSESINYEEYTFSRQTIRMQNHFAAALKRSFIVHLKFRGLWDLYKLNQKDFKIKFVKPVLYDLYEQQKILNIKSEIYSTFADREEFSKTLCMKKYLGLSDNEIKENYKYLKMEGVANNRLQKAIEEESARLEKEQEDETNNQEEKEDSLDTGENEDSSSSSSPSSTEEQL